MKRTTIVSVGIGVISLGLFILIALLLPVTRSAGYWFSFVFGILAVLLWGGGFLTALLPSDPSRQFIGLPIAQTLSLFLFVGFIWSFVGMIVPLPSWVIITVYAGLIGVALMILLGLGTSTAVIGQADAKVKASREFYDASLEVLNYLAASSVDSAARQAIGKLRDEVRYSDPVSGLASERIEVELANGLANMRDLVTDPAQIVERCSALTLLVRERARIIKNNK